MHRACVFVFALVTLLSIAMATPVTTGASSRLKFIRYDPTTQQTDSYLDRLYDLVMSSKAAAYLWACNDDSTMGWCGSGDTQHGETSGRHAGGLEVAFVIFASSLIVTAVCSFFSRQGFYPRSIAVQAYQHD